MNTEASLSHIRNGYIVALISVGITIVAYFFQIDANDINLFSDPSIFIDVIIGLILAFGIYKRSRVCAVIMLIYFIVGKIIYYNEMTYYGINLDIQTIVVALVFIYFYAQAVRGTFAFHKTNNQKL
tara:strand:- start:162 stop:539 length:378 start_codon:yes stop_codon:yes gene_type:complete